MGKNLSGAEFTEICLADLGKKWGWQVRVAELMGVNLRTVQRWTKDGIPARIAGDLFQRLGVDDEQVNDIKNLHQDNWFLADGAGNRKYIICLQPPRFVARVVYDGEAENTISGLSYNNDDFTIFNIRWLDTPPPPRIQNEKIEETAGMIYKLNGDR